jgi:hypothetical protein
VHGEAQGCGQLEEEWGVAAVTFRCWDSLNTDESETHVVEAPDSERAAVKLAERRFCDDYPRTQEISVRAPDGTLSRWDVLAEETIVFRARRAEE